MNITIPIKALRLPGGIPAAMEGEEESVAPEVNDPVSFHVEGVVTGIKGDEAEVDVRFVNGERPEPKSKKKEGKEAEADSDEDLSRLAAEADEASY